MSVGSRKCQETWQLCEPKKNPSESMRQKSTAHRRSTEGWTCGAFEYSLLLAKQADELSFTFSLLLWRKPGEQTVELPWIWDVNILTHLPQSLQSPPWSTSPHRNTELPRRSSLLGSQTFQPAGRGRTVRPGLITAVCYRQNWIFHSCCSVLCRIFFCLSYSSPRRFGPEKPMLTVFQRWQRTQRIPVHPM